MPPYLPPGPHVPHGPGSVLQSRQLDARPFLRLDHARQLQAEIILLGLPRPHHTASEFKREVPYADHRIDRYVNPGNSNAQWRKIPYCK